MVGRRIKIWLRPPKGGPQKTDQNLDQSIIDSKSHVWNSFFENIILGIQLFCIRPHITRVFFYFRFSRRKFQSQQKLPKKIIHFTMQFRSINLSHFMNFNSLEIENNMLPQHSKTFLTLQILQQILSCLVSEKTFALHHFLTPKNYILEAL